MPLDDDLRRTLQEVRTTLGLAPSPTSAQPAQTPNNPNPSPKLPYWFSREINSYTFDLNKYLGTIPQIQTLLKSPLGRVAMTRNDPLLFALVYLPHHLKDKNNPTQPPTFADCHFEWCRQALLWAALRNRTTPPQPQEDRNAEIAPRNCGKSTWWFLILPLWAAAHQHKEFAAAFASTATQAETHLKTFKNELDSNKYLREDFPDLCQPQRRLKGTAVADRQDQYNAQSGFVFVAKGVDSSNLGMKVDEARPDLIIIDDVEPDEASYNADLARKRLNTITDAILPLNIYASVVFVGTVTMPGSIIHQLVKHARKQETYQWIDDESIKPHYYPPILKTAPTPDNPAGQRSLWPEKWPLEYLIRIQNSRSYAKNYANDPKGRDGDYWNWEDFTHHTIPRTKLTRTAIFIDPPTTTSRTSDPAGIAIVSWNPPTPADFDNLKNSAEKGAPPELLSVAMSHAMKRSQHPTNTLTERHPGTVSILHAEQQKLTGRKLALHTFKLIEMNPHLNIRLIVIEATQGGDLWLETFANAPTRVRIITPRESKEIRFGRALEYYQKTPSLVTHDPNANLATLEEQQMGFPKHQNDDVADAAVSGILYFLEPPATKQKVKVRARSYLR